MENHLNSEEILAFSRRRMEPEEMLRADGHLETCAACREQLVSLRTGAAADPIPVPRPHHLNWEQLRAMAQNTAVSADWQTHLAACALCRTEIEDLRRFAGMLAEPETPAPVEIAPRRRAWFAAPAWRWASAAALVAVLAVGVAELAPVERNFSAQLAGAQRISDNGASYLLDARGDVLGWPGLPDTYRKAIRAAIAGGGSGGQIDPADARKRFGSSHLVMGVAYLDAGLTAQARAEFAQLQRDNPRAAVVERLLAACARR